MVTLFKNKAVKIISVILAVVILIVATLSIGTAYSKNYKAWKPNYEMKDIKTVLQKTELSADDYALLFNQTGLTKIGVDAMISAGRILDIVTLQQQYFETQQFTYKSFAPFMGYMINEELIVNAPLENGDILFSPSTFVSMIKMGHSSVVVNEELSTTAQAIGYGKPVSFIHASNIFVRPSFVIARVKASKQTRDEVASYVSNELYGKGYDILAGIFEKKAPNSIKKTHCSHLIWYAYNHFGIDIDATRGKIVTPLDLVLSTNVEIIQIFGLNPKQFNL